jgi:hypothetical protein
VRAFSTASARPARIDGAIRLRLAHPIVLHPILEARTCVRPLAGEMRGDCGWGVCGPPVAHPPGRGFASFLSLGCCRFAPHALSPDAHAFYLASKCLRFTSHGHIYAQRRVDRYRYRYWYPFLCSCRWMGSNSYSHSRSVRVLHP